MLQNIALQNLQILLYNRKCERLKNWYIWERKNPRILFYEYGIFTPVYI
jgi:hypothetical protein